MANTSSSDVSTKNLLFTNCENQSSNLNVKNSTSSTNTNNLTDCHTNCQSVNYNQDNYLHRKQLPLTTSSSNSTCSQTILTSNQNNTHSSLPMHMVASNGTQFGSITNFSTISKRDKHQYYENLQSHCVNSQNMPYTNTSMLNLGVSQNNLSQLQFQNHMVANSLTNNNMSLLNNCFNNSNNPFHGNNLMNSYENFNEYNNLNSYNFENINSSFNLNNQHNSSTMSLHNNTVDNIMANNNLIIRNTFGNSFSPIDMQDQERIKLERKRLRNRIAATKCRQRKLEKISKLEENNSLLKNDVENLNKLLNKSQSQIMLLRDQIMEHINSGCIINKPIVSNEK